MRKHVERASHDLRAVITTYEGKHNHDVPAARGSGSHAVVNRSTADVNVTTAIRPSAMFGRGGGGGSQGQGPFTLEMLQPQVNYGMVSGYDNAMASYLNHQQQQKHLESVMISKAKDEPKDDLFIESLLC